MAEEDKKKKVSGSERRRARAEGANVDGTVLAPSARQVSSVLLPAVLLLT
jgi:hypothetical protein